VQSCGLDNGKDKPPVKCFTSILDAGVMLNGYYRDGVVYITADLAPAGVADVAQLSDRLLKVAMEEVAHYVTGATDNSRDFQDYLLDLAVKLSRARVAATCASSGSIRRAISTCPAAGIQH
jgi:major membrane immunogen (membrane-anchored lipoprotein)